MSRYKEHHEPTRRAYDSDEDDSPKGRIPDVRPKIRKSAPPAGVHALEPVDAVVKWFNPEKGFGFVTMVGGPDAFIHGRIVTAAGYRSLSEGMHLKVLIGPGQKGPQVSTVLEVDTSAEGTVEHVGRPRRSSQRQASERQVDGPIEECVGSVKWYDAERGFGFIGRDTDGKDVFVHVKALERGGLSRLAEGQRVRMKFYRGEKGPEARSVQLIE